MSLFIGSLAFTAENLQNHVKLGVFSGSMLAAIVGWIILRFAGAERT
jgi:NhaA family Na+:H+ antiporter